MQRAAVSVTSNVAEGFGRRNQKEKVQFYYIAHGSLTELKNVCLVAKDIGYMPQDVSEPIFELLARTKMLLLGLIKKTKGE